MSRKLQRIIEKLPQHEHDNFNARAVLFVRMRARKANDIYAKYVLLHACHQLAPPYCMSHGTATFNLLFHCFNKAYNHRDNANQRK